MPEKKTKGSFTKETRKAVPPRGKAKKTLMLDAIKSVCGNEQEFLEKVVLFGLGGWTKPEQKEEEEPVDPIYTPPNPMLLNLVISRIEPPLKATSPLIEFEFNEKLKPHEQAGQIMNAVASGLIAPDIGQMFVSSIKSMIEIEEYTDLKERIEKLEAVLNGES